MITCQELIEKLEERYPRMYACGWDNTGLLAGDREQADRVYCIGCGRGSDR